MFTWLFAFFRKPDVAEPDTPVAEDVVATHVTDIADPAAEAIPIADVLDNAEERNIKKTKNRQINWMISDCTEYRNDHGVRCTFYSNLRDASLAFRTIVENAIDRMKDDYYKCNFDNVSEEAEEFFTSQEFDSRTHVYHKGRAFSKDYIRVYLSEVHLGKNYCAEIIF
jgi:hypothetical protein